MRPSRAFCLSIALILLSVFSVSAQDSKRALTIDDFFKMKNIGNPVVSPDGKWVAFTVSETDLKKDKSETRIWMISTDGGEAIPLTSKGYSAGRPAWSPDGKYLGFIASKDKEEKSQVFALNMRGGEAQALTSVKHGVSDFEWSPDSKRLLLSIRDPEPWELTEDKEDDKKARPYVVDRLQFKRDYAGYLDRYRTHLYVFDIGSESEPRQITSGDYDEREAVWSPDGKSVAFVSNRSAEPDSNPNSDIWIVSADNADKGATLLQVTKNPREDSSPQWSPDGKTIAYVTITSPLKTMWYAVERLATVSATGGTPKVLTSGLDRNIRQPKFSKDGGSIYFRVEDSGEEQIVSMPSGGGAVTRHVSGSLAVGNFDIAGDTIAVMVSKRDMPDEVFVYKSIS